MYLLKARKQLDEQDTDDREKGIRDRNQRSDPARLLLQGVPVASTSQANRQDFQKELDASSTLMTADIPTEELLNGACCRPKKDILVKRGRSESPATGTANGTVQNEVASLYEMAIDVNNGSLRQAEYIGTFSVSGSDKQAREKQMEIQLQQMRGVSGATPVSLVISVDGVKVINSATQNMLMEHSLKRIWYATCDPEHCQFSFLAREPKTSAEVQYCHAFLTQTSQEAEELISLMGNAFKATGPPISSTAAVATNATRKQPTFHELIEKQVLEQQAKFREIEKASKLALQQKLTEIATPTTFSDRVGHRMGNRRFSEGGGLDKITNKNKMWAKQLISQELNNLVDHPNKNSYDQNNSSVTATNISVTNNNHHRRSEIPVQSSSPQSSPFKRNSVPPQVKENIPSSSPSSVPSSPAHPLSAQSIRASLGSKQASSKFKGSPVTALKNEIDKRLLLDESGAFPMPKPDMQPTSAAKDKPVVPKTSMANRPLPSPPEESAQEPRGRSRAGRGGADGQVRRSLDDNNLMGDPVSQVKMRNSPRRGQARPMSEIAVSSSSSAFFNQQRQSLLHNFASSFNSPRELEALEAATAIAGSSNRINTSGKRNSSGNIGNMYIPPHLQEPVEPGSGKLSNHNSPSKSRNGKVEKRDRSGGSDGGRKRSDPIPPSFPIPPVPSQQQQQQEDEQEVYEELLEDAAVVVPSRKTSAAGGGGPEVLRYQNGSPFYHGDPDGGGTGAGWGLESLMTLDRSHIHDVTLRNSPWYQAGLAREIALDILQQEEVGAFIVRDSSTHPGCFALSVRVPRFENSSGISHYLILRTHRGVKLKGLEKEWSSLQALVTHHTVMREMLPCTLRLPKTAPPLTDEVRSSGDGMERGDNYTDMTEEGRGGPALMMNVAGGKNY